MCLVARVGKTHLLIEELQVGGAFVLDVLGLFLFRCLFAGPGRLVLIPLLLLVFVAVPAVQLEVILKGFLPICELALAKGCPGFGFVSEEGNGGTYSSWQWGGC